MDYRIRLFQEGNDRQQLKALGLPLKYINQYTNSPPLHYALWVLGLCVNYLYLMTADNSRQIIGTILLRRKLDIFCGRFSWRIHAVYVAPELRGKGLGVKLMNHVTAQLRDWHVAEVRLKVDSDNEPAISLYKKCGFVEDVVIKSQLVLVKHIS